MRTPAPVSLFYVPARWAVRRVRKNRDAAKVTARHERRTTELLERQAERLGITVNESVAIAEPTPGVAFEMAAGEQLEAARSWLYKHRRDVLAPIGAAAALMALRWVVHLAGAYTWTDFTLAAVPVLAVFGAGVWWVLQVDPRGVSPWRKRAAGLTVFAALLWLLAPVMLPVPIWPHRLSLLPTVRLSWLDGPADFLPDWPLTYALLVLATTVAVTVRWGRFQPRAAVAPPSVGPAETWAATHGSDGWPLAGSRLTGLARIITSDGTDAGWTAYVECVPGKHNATKVRSQLEDIAGVYGRDEGDASVERTGNALRPRLAVMEREPFPASLDWPGANLSSNGVSPLGTFYDAQTAEAAWWVPGAGSRDAWFFGKKGSGKSTIVNTALGSVMSQGLAVLHLTDLKGGMSLPQWADIAHRYGTSAADGMLRLQCLEAIGDARVAAAKEMEWFAPGDPKPRKGVDHLEVSLEWPLHIGLFEEAPQMWRVPGALEIAERIVTLFRAVNVSLWLISQMAELRQAFNNSSTLREQIQAGTVWAGYVGKTQARLGFDNFDPDLSALKPDTYRSYLYGVQQREALMKAYRISDPWAVARGAVPGTPNPVDEAAIREIEDREAGRQSARSGDGASILKLPGRSVVTRNEVEAAVLKLIGDSDAKVTTGAVSAATGPDEIGGPHYEKVRKLLQALGSDPSSPVASAGHGKWGWAA